MRCCPVASVRQELPDSAAAGIARLVVRYPPGSTIKPMLALAAMDAGTTAADHRMFCRGFFTLPGKSHRYRDWKPEGHGPVDLHDAVSQSCDVYFYEIATEIGITSMHVSRAS